MLGTYLVYVVEDASDFLSLPLPLPEDQNLPAKLGKTYVLSQFQNASQMMQSGTPSPKT